LKKYNVKTAISYPKIGAMGKTGTWIIAKAAVFAPMCALLRL